MTVGRSREYFSSWQIFRDCDIHRLIPADRYYSLWIHHHPDSNFNKWKGSLALSPRVWDTLFRHDLNRQVGMNHRLPKFDEGIWFGKRNVKQSTESQLLFDSTFLPTITSASNQRIPYVRRVSEEGRFPVFVHKDIEDRVCKDMYCDGTFDFVNNNDIQVHLKET